MKVYFGMKLHVVTVRTPEGLNDGLTQNLCY